MKKMPTLFERVYENHRIVDILPNVTPGFEWVLEGEGIATTKFDGACCAIIDGIFYKRFDAKKGRKIPEGAIPCCEPDPITGHWSHWVEVNKDNPADKWFVEAFCNTFDNVPDIEDGTYEAIGPHFQGNPYELRFDSLVKHGESVIYVDRTFDAIKSYLLTHPIEGIVFWKDSEPQCKIKKSDFGFEWPIKK